MIGFAWVTLRQAQEALRSGHLEEAHRLLGQSAARGHKRFWELAPQVARAYAERGECHLRQENPEAAWHDLLQAEQLGGAGDLMAQLRQSLVRQGLSDARSLLQAGDPEAALDLVQRLRERTARHPDLQMLEECARGWQAARDHAHRGECKLALESMERVRRLLPEGVALDQLRRDIEENQRLLTGLLGKLHEAMGGHRWREVMDLCDQVLAAAPNHAEARRARAAAWRAVEPPTKYVRAPVRLSDPPQADPEPAPRFFLWIDGVGGYLVCLGSRVALGQATGDATVDVPLFADVSRHHATVTRDSEGGYMLEAARPATVNGKAVEKAVLRSNDRVTLGTSCQLQFLQPAAISTSARLDLVSKHRLILGVDGVLLMADTLVLGPGSQAHVTVPDLTQPVVIYRNKDRLAVRYSGNLFVDGQRCTERGALTLNSTVNADDLAFALEPVDRKGS